MKKLKFLPGLMLALFPLLLFAQRPIAFDMEQDNAKRISFSVTQGANPVLTYTYYDTIGDSRSLINVTNYVGQLIFSNNVGGRTMTGDVSGGANGEVVFTFVSADVSLPGTYEYNVVMYNSDTLSYEYPVTGRLEIIDNVAVTNENNLGSLYVSATLAPHNSLSDLQGGNGSDEYYHLNLAEHTRLITLTAHIITQLLNIGAVTTISTQQWTNFGASDQGWATTDDVTFNSVTGDVIGDVTADTLTLNPITAPTHAAGTLFYDTDDDELSWYNSIADTQLNIGSEHVNPVRNASGSTINDFVPVYQTGSVGKRATIDLAQADAVATCNVIGVTTYDIDNNTNGAITVLGLINGVDTDGSPYSESWADGEAIWLSATAAGEFTNVMPDAPNCRILVGFVRESANLGSFYVHLNGQNTGTNDTPTFDSLDLYTGAITATADIDINPAGGDINLAASDNLNMTGSLSATGARVLKAWVTDLESTNHISIGGTALTDQYLATTDDVEFNSLLTDEINSTAELDINSAVVQDVSFWDGISSGNPSLNLYGWSTIHSATKTMNFSVDSAGDGTISSDESLVLNPGSETTEFIGNLQLESTTDSSTGVIYKDSGRFIHDFTPSGGDGNNLFFGVNAGNFTMTAPSSFQSANLTGIGHSALYSNTTGFGNTAIGTNSLYNNTSGSNSTAYGTNALFSNTTNGNNSSFGTLSLYLNTGSSNSGFGAQALYSNVSGSNNSGLGYRAGRYIAGGSTPLTDVENAVFLGANTKALSDSSTNEIVIGYDTTGHGSNTVTIGNADITDNYFTGNFYLNDAITSGNPSLNLSGWSTTHSGLKAMDFSVGSSGDGTIATDVNLVLDPTGGVVEVDGYLLQDGIYGGIHLHDGSTAQLIDTGATYEKCTLFTDDNLDSNVTSDATNDKITITVAGVYEVKGSFSFVSGTANVVWFGTAFLNGVEQDSIHFNRKASTSTDVGSAGFSGTINVSTVPWDLDFRLRHDNGSDTNITITYGNLNVKYVGAAQ